MLYNDSHLPYLKEQNRLSGHMPMVLKPRGARRSLIQTIQPCVETPKNLIEFEFNLIDYAVLPNTVCGYLISHWY